MAYSDYTQFRRPEPRLVNTESQYGHEYEYRYPDAEELPEILVGEIWEDGLAVTSAGGTQSIGNSGWSERVVSTVYSRSVQSEEASELEEERYSVRPSISQVELSLHPDFLPGGTSDLYSGTVTSGTWTYIPLAFVIAWENEPNPLAKARRKFYDRDADGRALPIGAPVAIDVPAGAATAYVKLRQLGFSTKDVYNPIWQKISTYRGANIPITGSWGQYFAAEDVDGLPEDVAATYPHWIKTGDSADRIGDQRRWQRVEEWTGYTAVYFDVDTLNPAGLTLP